MVHNQFPIKDGEPHAYIEEIFAMLVTEELLHHGTVTDDMFAIAR